LRRRVLSVGIHIRKVRLLTGLLILLPYFVIFTGAVLCNQDSNVMDLGTGSRPIYRIGYSGGGSADIDELIDLARRSSFEEPDPDDGGTGEAVAPEGQDSKTSKSDPAAEGSAIASTLDPASESESSFSDSVKDRPTEYESTDDKIDREGDLEKRAEDLDYVRVPIVSSPPSAEVYIDGMYYGVTPFIATVEPESHLIEAYLDGYWNWFNIVDFSESVRTIPIVFIPLPAENSSENNDSAVLSFSEVAPHSGGNETGNSTFIATIEDDTIEGDIIEDDFWDQNYRKILMMVAFLSFLIGSGSIATWARSRMTTSVKINFPRDGEDKWAGLIEGQSNRVYGTKRSIYVLVRHDDDKLQVRNKATPNRDGRWFTRCEVEEGTVYRIYAVVTDNPMPEGIYIEEIPSYRDISEVGPVIGRKRTTD